MARTIRPLRPENAPSLSRLLDWAWFAPRSEAGWRWLEAAPRSGPARDVPTGWVVVDEVGAVVGMCGLFAQDYVVDGETVAGVTGHTLVVHPQARGAGARLVRDYMQLPQAHGLFGAFHFNGNARSADLYRRLGLQPWPPGRSDLKLVWPTDPLAILAERAVRAAAALTGGRRPDHERFLRSGVFTTALNRLEDGVEQVFAHEIDHRFDAFWADLAAEGRLTARRDAASLRWRMADPDRTLDPFLLVWLEGGCIGGFLLAQIGKVSEIEFPSLEIIDLVALKDCAARAAPALVRSLAHNAARLGVARMRLSVATREMERLLAAAPGAVGVRGHDHGHAAFTRAGLSMASRWRLTPYDGDYGFCLRSPPRPAVLGRAA